MARELPTSTPNFSNEDAQECANIRTNRYCNEISNIISGAPIPSQRAALEVCATLPVNQMVFFRGKDMVYSFSKTAF
jgi:hypothetical protein